MTFVNKFYRKGAKDAKNFSVSSLRSLKRSSASRGFASIRRFTAFIAVKKLREVVKSEKKLKFWLTISRKCVKILVDKFEMSVEAGVTLIIAKSHPTIEPRIFRPR